MSTQNHQKSNSHLCESNFHTLQVFTPHPLLALPQKTMRCFIHLSFIAIFLHPALSQAHVNDQPRVVHILSHHNVIEMYINFLPPKSSKMLFFQAFFDRDKNHTLNIKERLALGQYLAKRFFQNLNLQFEGDTYIFKMKEIQNSRLRGNPSKQRFSWDIRYQVKGLSLKVGSNLIKLKLPLLSKKESIPIAFLSMSGDRLTRTKSTSIIQRKGRTYALCTIQSNRPFCDFTLYRKRRITTQPTSKSSKPSTQRAESKASDGSQQKNLGRKSSPH